jgi:hypothetical protein
MYFCNIRMKHLQHTSKIYETFKLYTCNMLHILVRPPPPSASGRRCSTVVAGGETRGLSRQGPTLLLALAALVGIIRRGRQRSGSSEADTRKRSRSSARSGGAWAAAEQGGRQENESDERRMSIAPVCKPIKGHDMHTTFPIFDGGAPGFYTGMRLSLYYV